MAVIDNATLYRRPVGEGESTIHLLAHSARLVLRPMLIAFLAATVVAMATIFPFAVFTGGLAVICGVLLWLAGRIEDHSEAGAIPRELNPPETIESKAVPIRTARGRVVETDEVSEPDDGALGPNFSSRLVLREARTVGGIVAALVILSVGLGFFVFDWHIMALGIGIAFLYMVIVSFPAWAAWLEGEVEDETKRERREQLQQEPPADGVDTTLQSP